MGTGSTSESGQEPDDVPMDGRLEPLDVIDIVGRRADVLAELFDGPKGKPALETSLGVSRSTVYKAIRELEERCIVERTAEGYQLSLTGQLLLEQYRQFRSTVENICQAGSLLAVLPHDSTLPVELLAEADVVYPKRFAPHHPATVLDSIVDGASEVRGMSPVVLPRYVDLFRDALGDGDFEAELVLEKQVVEWLRTEECDSLTTAAGTGNLRLCEVDHRLPYGLVVSETPEPRVAVFIYDTQGELRGVVRNDSECAVAWGVSTWEQFRTGATELSAEGLIDHD